MTSSKRTLANEGRRRSDAHLRPDSWTLIAIGFVVISIGLGCVYYLTSSSQTKIRRQSHHITQLQNRTNQLEGELKRQGIAVPPPPIPETTTTTTVARRVVTTTTRPRSVTTTTRTVPSSTTTSTSTSSTTSTPTTTCQTIRVDGICL